MKTRESGMPDEAAWDAFFDPPAIFARLNLAPLTGHVVEFGCGYGTFTIPAAERCSGLVYAFDIDPEMVARTAARAARAGRTNIVAQVRDFIENGTGVPDEYADYAMLFNILHAEDPAALLREAWRVLRPGGTLGVIHWNYDPSTPRGPRMEIRPRPQQCRDWALAAGFSLSAPGIVSLPPYHYGMALKKP